MAKQTARQIPDGSKTVPRPVHGNGKRRELSAELREEIRNLIARRAPALRELEKH